MNFVGALWRADLCAFNTDIMYAQMIVRMQTHKFAHLEVGAHWRKPTLSDAPTCPGKRPQRQEIQDNGTKKSESSAGNWRCLLVDEGRRGSVDAQPGKAMG
ncbi:hypothetical protein [Ensifer sp. M14]|uniref:hypothetical protein n=1 Tax=Ensifer sp. M14 TaxID=2203782 RepID=UPI001314A686|nr:hypothetical protein [Ensifer sp. M14]